LWDGYSQKSLAKGVWYILLFFVFVAVGNLMLAAFGLYFVFLLPVIVLFYAVFFRKKKQKSSVNAPDTLDD
jgi:hypothetical protein